MRVFALIFCFGLLPSSILNAGRFDEVDTFFKSVSDAYYSGEKKRLLAVFEEQIEENPNDIGAWGVSFYYFCFFEANLDRLKLSESNIRRIINEEMPESIETAESMMFSLSKKLIEDGYPPGFEDIVLPMEGRTKSNTDAIDRVFLKTAKILSIAQVRARTEN